METIKVLEDNERGITVDVIDELVQRGYSHTFRVHPKYAICTETDEKFLPYSMSLKGIFRYEGITNPDDQRVLYAIEANNGTRGVIVDAFGVYSDPIISEFIDTVPDARSDSHLGSVPSRKTMLIYTSHVQ